MTARQAPEVSVIIPCYNVAQTLPLQLEALATQADAPPFEVIIVDNNSTDDLGGVVSSWQDRVSFDLRLVSAREAQGSSYARNVGIRESRADLLMFCDGDDVVSQWWVAHGVRTLEYAELWSGSAILLTDSQIQLPLEKIRLTIDDSPTWEPPVDEQRGAFPTLMGGNFGATKQALTTLGGFDQSLAFSGDDNDLAFRANRAGYRVLVSKSVRIGYRGKWDLKTRLRLTYRSAKAHSLIASRYGAWTLSPYPAWPKELLRCLGAAIKMLVSHHRRDWTGLALRTTAALGVAVGKVAYRSSSRQPKALVGMGWIDTVNRKEV